MDIAIPPRLSFSSLPDALRYRARTTPNARVLTFLKDGETEEGTLTFEQLDQRARAIATAIRKVANPGDRVLLFYQPCLEYIAGFYGCLYAGAVAVPVYPPDPLKLSRSLQRLQGIVEDAKPSLILSTHATMTAAAPYRDQTPQLEKLKWLATDAVALEGANEWTQPDWSGLSYLQYTSGSTSSPRGVMISHHNLIHQGITLCRTFCIDETQTMVIWLPLFHDMGLLTEIVMPVVGGAHCVAMAPSDFVREPSRWLSAISRYRASFSMAPNFAYALCTRKVTEAQKAALDLRAWRFAVNAAEPVRHETVLEFSKAFASCGFVPTAHRPVYGLAESTLIVTGATNQPYEAVETTPGSYVVGCGPVVDDQEVVIVDPQTLRPVTDAQGLGEIWVAGPDVADGYFQRPEATETIFRATLEGQADGKRFLRTGDLGFIKNGQVFINGRIKDLIIVRGRNIYPQDVEYCVERSHPALRPGGGAAFSHMRDGVEDIIMVHEVYESPTLAVAEVAAAMSRAVSQQHEVPLTAVALIKKGSLPKTSSGKVQRQACLKRYLNNELELVAPIIMLDKGTTNVTEPTDALEAALLDAYREVLENQSIGTEDDFWVLGGSSLASVELSVMASKVSGKRVTPNDIFEYPTVVSLAERVRTLADEANVEAPVVMTRAEERALYPLSPSQTRYWLDYPTDTGKSWSNLQFVLDIDVTSLSDEQAIQRAFELVIQRHEALRTSFVANGAGAPLQRIAEHVSFSVTHTGPLTAEETSAFRRTQARSIFDLSKAPLLRAAVVTERGRQPTLTLTFHHLICDGWSVVALTQEIFGYYQALREDRTPRFEPPPFRYRDFSEWQNRLLSTGALSESQAYWEKTLQAPRPGPLFRERRHSLAVADTAGASCALRLTPALVSSVEEAAKAMGTSPFMVVFTAYMLLLHRVSGRDDVIVGSPLIGRNDSDSKNVVGFFINLSMLRSTLQANDTFRAAVKRMHAQMWLAMRHQAYPLHRTLQNLGAESEEHSFGLTNAFMTRLAYPENVAKGFAPDLARHQALTTDVRFELMVYLLEYRDGLVIDWRYRAQMFSQPEMEQLARSLNALLETLIASPDAPLAPQLTGEAKRTTS